MIDDIIRETPAYKVLTREAREEGIEIGFERGIERGIEQGIEQERKRALQLQRELLLNVVKARFPKLVRLARKQGSVIDEAKVLNDLIVKVSAARTMEEARQHLLAVDEGKKICREEQHSSSHGRVSDLKEHDTLILLMWLVQGM